MKADDDRDERLARVLDIAVADLRPERRDAGRLVRRGSIRRVGIAAISIATAAAFVGAIAFAGTQVARDAAGPPGSETTPSGTVPNVIHVDAEDGITVSHPASWTVAEERLTPALSDPREILSLGSFTLRPGGVAPTDAYLPGNALDDMGSGDVFVTIQERVSGGIEGYPPRPERFRPETVCPPDDDPCLEGRALGLDVRSWWIPFRDDGRAFYAFVAMGDAAFHDDPTFEMAWAVMDSLDVQAAP